ncbi:MAG: hypothetical protein B6226_01020 [Candidatus Cloacimonetes bacterium 4572_65]|nr:MAG: hypothetical protein B6226_01020 [Candidatus Cloacimonetes bacterium 4572_65]
MLTIDGLLLNISTGCFTFKELEKAVVILFEKVCREIEIDRCFLRLFDNQALCRFTINWQQPDLPQSNSFDLNLNLGEYHFIINQLTKNKIFAVNSLSTFTADAPNENAFLRKNGIKSILITTLTIGGDFGGLIGFTNFTKERVWSDSDIILINKIAAVLSSALIDLYTKQILSAHSLDTVYNRFSTINYIADYQTQKIKYITKQALPLLGYTADTIIDKKKFLDFLVESEIEAFNTFLDKITDENQHVYDMKMKNKDGKELWFRNYFCLKKNDYVHNIQGFLVDITDRKKLQLEQKKYNSLLESLIDQVPLGIFTKSATDGKYEIWNKEMERISKQTKAQVIGKKDSELFDSTVANKFALADKKVLDNCNKKFSLNIEEVFKNKRNLTLSSKKSVLKYDNIPQSILCVVKDITVFNAKEKELKKALKKANEVEALKTAFLSNISHEFRTPLNAVLGFSDFLYTNQDVEPEVKNEYLKLISNGAKRLISLMDNVISVSKIESKNISKVKSKIALNEFLIGIEQHYKLELLNKKSPVELNFVMPRKDKEVLFISDETNIKCILDNLINNAIKFTEKGSIEIGFSSDYKDRVLFYVKDTGVGIKKELKNSIFNSFMQANSSFTREFGGVGIGLTICANLVNHLGGDIFLDSDIGVGSNFMFNLPGKVELVPIDKNMPQVKRDVTFDMFNEISDTWEGKTILVVDDTPHIIKFFEAFFNKINITLITANNGVDAVRICKENSNINLVLMDIQMPKMNGLEATENIRKFNTTLPIIAQTAYAFDSENIKILKAGCDDYVSKPINRKELLLKINRYI